MGVDTSACRPFPSESAQDYDTGESNVCSRRLCAWLGTIARGGNSMKLLLLKSAVAALTAFALAGCGTTRVLTSLTVSPAAAAALAPGTPVQFTATGIFNQTPTPVTPFTVGWTSHVPFTATPNSLVTIDSTGLAHCNGFVGTSVIGAFHPVDLQSPLPATDPIGGGAGFVSATAQLTCPAPAKQ